MALAFQERVTVTLDGIDLGVWDMFSGGAAKASSEKHRDGGMGPEYSAGGLPTRDDFTLQRFFKLERDLPLVKQIDAKVGHGYVQATRQMLNPDRSTAGDPITFTGTLTGYVHPDSDSFASTKKMVQLEVSADEAIA